MTLRITFRQRGVLWVASQNNTRQKKMPRRSGVGTGTTSLLVIFTLLFMSTLGLLSLSTALSNQRIMRRGFTSMHNLTTAKGEAAQMLADLDDALLTAAQAGEKGYAQRASAAVAGLGWEVNQDEQTAQIYVTIDENNALVTSVKLLPFGSSLRYALQGQTMLMVGEWVPDGATVWPG